MDALEASAGVEITKTKELKVRNRSPLSSLSSDEDGLGRVRVKKKLHPTSQTRCGSDKVRYKKLVSRNDTNGSSHEHHRFAEQSTEDKTVVEPQSRSGWKQVERSITVKSRSDVHRLSSLSSGHSIVDNPIDQNTWDTYNDIPISRRSSDEWSDSTKCQDAIIDFAQDSNDEEIREVMMSSGDESSYNGSDSEDDSREDWQVGILQRKHPVSNWKRLHKKATVRDMLSSDRQSSFNEPKILPVGKKSISLSSDENSTTFNASTTSSPPPATALKSKTQRAYIFPPSSNTRFDESDALYPFSPDESISEGVWAQTINDMQSLFSVARKKENSVQNGHFHLPTPKLSQPCPHTVSFIKKSLGQVGVVVVPEAPTSATVGATLTYAITASAAAPLTIVGAAASQIANTARDVFGANNEVTKACQTINRSTKRLTTKFKSEEKTSNVPGTNSTESNQLKGIQMGVRTTWQGIRARPSTGVHVPLTSINQTSSCEDVLDSHSRSPVTLPSSDFVLPVSKAIVTPTNARLHHICSYRPTESTLSSGRFSSLNPSILRYRKVITRTADGQPCQSRIQLRFCRICKKYQVRYTHYSFASPDSSV